MVWLCQTSQARHRGESTRWSGEKNIRKGLRKEPMKWSGGRGRRKKGICESVGHSSHLPIPLCKVGDELDADVGHTSRPGDG